MRRSRTVSFTFLCVAVLMTPCWAIEPQEVLTNDSVIQMCRAGLGDEVIVSAIRQNPGRYALGVSDLIALKSAGIKDAVINEMQKKNEPVSTTVAPAVPSVPASPAGNVLPCDPGIYVRTGDQWTEMRPENTKVGSGAWGFVTRSGSSVKETLHVEVAGEHSRMQLGPEPEFLVVTTARLMPEDYLLLRAEDGKKDKREFRVVVVTARGAYISVTPTDKSRVEYSSQRVEGNIYRLKVSALKQGEYTFLAPLSPGMPPLLNRAFTFGVE